jgi:hypothetical protein
MGFTLPTCRRKHVSGRPATGRGSGTARVFVVLAVTSRHGKLRGRHLTTEPPRLGCSSGAVCGNNFTFSLVGKGRES